MAVIDSILNGCLPIIPDTALYRKMLGAKGCYWHDLKQSIMTYLNNPKELNVELLEKIKLPCDDFNLETFILTEIQSRIQDKTPAKYDEVTEYIRSHFNAKKKDYVNKFWGFHANSNFQIIRWKLLNEGYIDNTYRHETSY